MSFGDISLTDGSIELKLSRIWNGLCKVIIENFSQTSVFSQNFAYQKQKIVAGTLYNRMHYTWGRHTFGCPLHNR